MTDALRSFDEDVQIWRQIQALLRTMPREKWMHWLDKLADGADLADLLAAMRMDTDGPD